MVSDTFKMDHFDAVAERFFERFWKDFYGRNDSTH